MTDLSLLTWVLVVAALVLGILAGHFGWGKRWPGPLSKLHPDYLTGLDYLVTEQPDRALDMFLKLMDANADTIETHFALGSLYRRRGEVERAIRIHQNLLARDALAPEHREQALLALAQDYLRAGLLDRAEGLFLAGQRGAASARRVRSMLCGWSTSGSTIGSRRWGFIGSWRGSRRPLRARLQRTTCASWPRSRSSAAIRRRRGACCAKPVRKPRRFRARRCCARKSRNATRIRSWPCACGGWRSPKRRSCCRMNCRSCCRLVAPQARDAVLGELAAQAESRDFNESKRLVFAAIAADLAGAPPLRALIEKVFAQDPTLQAVWRADPAQFDRTAREIGALLAHAEKYRCNECGFSGRSFYWHCPACHSWASFEAYAIVKLR